MTVSDRSKQEKAAKKAAKKEEENNIIKLNNKERDDIIKDLGEIIDSVGDTDGVDILKDNKLLSYYGPYSKLPRAYCYIHPINVILYDKTIEHGLIWKKNNNDTDNYENIISFFHQKKDSISPEIFKIKFKEQYDGISDNRDLIDLSKYKEIVFLTKKYDSDFSSGIFFYEYEGSKYVCESTKFDYKYKQGSFDPIEYFETHKIGNNLKEDEEKIKKLDEKLEEKIPELINLAAKNIKYNKEKTYDRQIESDKKLDENKDKILYYIFYVFLNYLKYLQDIFYAAIKSITMSQWNNVMTGFLILIFIIILIIVGISGGGEEKQNEGPNKKPKEENKDFLSVIKSIPADMNNIYNSAMKLSSDIGNMMSNSRRTLNDISDAITGDDNSDYIDRGNEEYGRGGDNFIHFDVGDNVYSKYSMKPTQIVPIINNINYDKQSQLDTINDTIKLGVGVKEVSVNEGGGEKFVPDCTSNINNYFDNKCKLIEYDPDSKVAIVKDSDYEQIKIND